MKLFSRLIFGVLMFVSPLIVLAQSCIVYINDDFWYWHDNNFYPTIITNTPVYTPYILSGVNHYSGATQLVQALGANGEGRIFFESTLGGFVVPPAYAFAWYGTSPCQETNDGGFSYDLLFDNCNKTDKRPSEGSIWLNNTRLFGNLTNGITEKLIRHELGHMFGLGHIDPICDGISFMPDTINLYSALNLHLTEALWINFIY